MAKKIFTLIGLFAIVAILLAGCAQPTPTQAPAVQTTAPAAQTASPAASTAEAAATTAAPAAAATTKPTSAPTAGPHTGKLILATTTSTQDSGLLEYLLPDFEKEFNTKIDVIAVGTGQAIQLGKDGNADVLLVHARSQEDAFMNAGGGTRREDVMYNDFVIVGPENDPAGIKGMTSAVDAFKKIADTQSTFISRGDKSGTNTKELAIWDAAGIKPSGKWYESAGQGMGEVLTMADEQQAYTLSDRATYLARTATGLKAKILVEGDKILLNPYGVIAVNPAKNPNIQTDLANKFIDWIISVPVQEKIGKFGVDQFGQQLFVPDSKPWHAAQGGTSAVTATP